MLDKTTGAARLNSGLFLTGDLAPAQITADQDDYNPAGLASASVLRLSSDASRSIAGLAGGGDGRVMAIVNAGANPIVLKDASTSSGAANRFAFGADVTLAAQRSAVLWYDATDSRWKLFAGPQAAGGGGGEVTSTGASTTGNIPKFSDTSADVIEDSGVAAANYWSTPTLASPCRPTTPTCGACWPDERCKQGHLFYRHRHGRSV